MSICLNFNNSFSQLPEIFYRRKTPQGLSNPQVVSFNANAAMLIGLAANADKESNFADLFCGNELAPGSDPLAMVYSGHQFGVYVPQLGDGRALLLGETINQIGEKWDVQLKGAGATPFSRMADGRAVLRSCIREYLCSEAMHGLGIPTTRALCIIGSEDPVYREEIETAAVMTRLSPSHVRFGSFEYFYYTKQPHASLLLADYVIDQHFSEWRNSDDRYQRLFEQAVDRTAYMIAQWQAVGFSHGVMNTDNMSILGLTLDYGPFGFMEDYDPGYICNHSDVQGRYAFNRQPMIGLFNLNCLAHAFTPMLSVEQLKVSLQKYERLYFKYYEGLMRKKIGLAKEMAGDDRLIADMLELLHANQVDYSIFLRQLSQVSMQDSSHPIDTLFKDQQGFYEWFRAYQARLAVEGGSDRQRAAAMNRVNPKYILRNYLAHQAIIEAQQGNYGEIDRLMQILSAPFDEHAEFEQYAVASPQWGKELEVSCSS